VFACGSFCLLVVVWVYGWLYVFARGCVSFRVSFHVVVRVRKWRCVVALCYVWLRTVICVVAHGCVFSRHFMDARGCVRSRVSVC
jgi:hypothetical protein